MRSCEHRTAPLTWPWPPPGPHLALTWPPPGPHLALTWPSPGPHLALTWPPPGPLTWPPHLALAWPSPGPHLALTWPPHLALELHPALYMLPSALSSGPRIKKTLRPCALPPPPSPRLAAVKYDWRPPETTEEAEDDMDQPEALKVALRKQVGLRARGTQIAGRVEGQVALWKQVGFRAGGTQRAGRV